jgi:hypothetical protein
MVQSQWQCFRSHLFSLKRPICGFTCTDTQLECRSHTFQSSSAIGEGHVVSLEDGSNNHVFDMLKMEAESLRELSCMYAWPQLLNINAYYDGNK